MSYIDYEPQGNMPDREWDARACQDRDTRCAKCAAYELHSNDEHARLLQAAIDAGVSR